MFLLNRFFLAMGRAIEGEGGHVDKFIGDGVMALFGIDDTPRAGCRSALRAVRAMAGALGDELPAPLRIGIGLHAGPVIVGEMGYGRAASVTATGDAVNVASRLETMAKEFACQAGLAPGRAPRRDRSLLSSVPPERNSRTRAPATHLRGGRRRPRSPAGLTRSATPCFLGGEAGRWPMRQSQARRRKAGAGLRHVDNCQGDTS